MAVCRVAGATELKVTHLQLKVVKAAHELLKKGNILAGVPPSGSWLAKKHATTVIRYWVKQLARGRMGFKAQRKPRKPKYDLSSAQLQACITEVTQNRCETPQVALDVCESVQAAMLASGCGLLYLWRKMRAYDPEFKPRVLSFKRELTQEQKDARYEYAEAHKQRRMRLRKTQYEAFRALGLTPTPLDLMVFVDQKKFYISAGDKVKVWMSPRCSAAVPGDAVEVPDLRGKGGVSWCIYYYSAVNALMGPVAIIMCSGCSGPGVEQSAYTVRTTVPGRM